MNERPSFLRFFGQNKPKKLAKTIKINKNDYFDVAKTEKRIFWRFFSFLLIPRSGQSALVGVTFPSAPDPKNNLWIVRKWRKVVPLTLISAFLASPLPITLAQQYVHTQTNTPKPHAASYQIVPLTPEDHTPTKTSLAIPVKKNFGTHEIPAVKVFRTGYTLSRDALPKGFSPDLPATIKQVTVAGPHGETDGMMKNWDLLSSGEQRVDELHLVPDKKEGYHPGLYTITSTITNGEQTATQEETFAWGVLVVNPNKSIYLPGEKAQLGMAVLDWSGKTLCEADLTLTITAPSGTATTLTTKDGDIKRSYDCDVHSVTNTPDYSATFTPDEVGTYKLKLESAIKGGQERTDTDQNYSIEDSFEVRTSVPFDVNRSDTPTRIYPVADYTAHLAITANESWHGPVTETIPASFEAYDISDGGTVSGALPDGTKTITWQVDWSKGDSTILSYRFNPPNPSPRIYPLGPLTINDFSETRSWQLAADATRVWDGGDTTASWSVAANWDANTLPNAGDTIVFDGSAGGTPTDASTWDSLAIFASIASLTVSASPPSTLTLTKTPATITGDFSYTTTGAVTYTSSAAITIGGNYTMTTSGTFTPNTSTVTMNGTGGKTINTSKTHSGLTIDPSSTGTITMSTNDFTVSALLTVAANDTLSIDSGRILTLSATSGTSLTLNGTVSGAGTVYYANATDFPTSGTFSAGLRLDTTSDTTPVMPARTYGGTVEVYNASGSASRSMALGTAISQTINIGGDLNLNTNTSNRTITVTGATNAPAVNITGSIHATGTGSAARTITTGTATWKVSTDVDLTSITWTASAGQTLRMDGTGNLKGNGQTIVNLTINGVNNVVTLTTSDVTVSTALTIGGAADGDNDKLIIDTGRTLITSATSGTSVNLIGSGTDEIDGPGRLTYRSGTTFLTTGALGSTLVLRFDAQTNNMVIPARTDYGTIEAYANALAARTITPGTGASQTITMAGSFLVANDSNTAGATLTIPGDTRDPTMNIGGDLDFTGTGSQTETINAPNAAANWKVSGNVDFTGGVYNGAAETVIMDGNNKNLIGNSQIIANLTINGVNNTVHVATSDVTVANVLTIGAASDGDNDTLTIDTSRALTLSLVTGTALTINDTSGGTNTINGDGRLIYNTTTTFPTTGTISCVVQFAFGGGNQVLAPRTFGGDVELNNVTANNRSVTTSTTGTITISGNLYLTAGGNGNTTFDVTAPATDNPVTIAKSIDFQGVGSGTEIITAGTGTWTVSASVDFTAGQYNTAAGNTLVMNGALGTLTTGTVTLLNLTIDTTGGGTITLANATHTVAGNLILTTGGTLTPGTSTISMTGAGTTIDGGGKTLANLSIGNSSGTITLQNTDLTVSTLLTLSGASSSLTLDATSSRTLTLSATSGAALSLAGTITGAGKLIYSTTTAFPTTGTINCPLRFNSTGGAQTISERTYGGAVEVYSNSGSARADVLATTTGQTIAFSSDLKLFSDSSGSGVLSVSGATNNPIVNITGDLIFDSTQQAAEKVVDSGSGTWTISGNLDLAGGVSAGSHFQTVILGGTTKTITDLSSVYDNLTINGSYTITNAAAPNGMRAGNLTINTGKSLAINSGQGIQSYGPANVTITGTGAITGVGMLNIANNATLGTTGTLSSVVRFDATDADGTMPARTYGGAVQIYLGNTASADHTIVMGNAATQTLQSTLTLINDDDNNLILSGVTNHPNVAITGTVAFTKNSTGTLDISTGTGAWSLSGDVNFTNGTFTATTNNTVTLNGGAKQTITSASQSFYNLTLTNTTGSFTGCGSPMTTPGIDFADGATISGTYTILTQNVKVEYEAGATYTINDINWNGVATDGIVFRSSAASAWNLDINGTQTDVSYVNVAYSDATLTSGGVAASNGTNTNCNNNTNWNFVSTAISITGTAYTDDNEATPLTSVSICVAVDASQNPVNCNTTNGSGVFTIPSVNAASGTQLTLFVDGGATFGNTVTKSDGGDIVSGDNLRVYQNHVVVRYETGSSLAIADMDAYDNDQNATDMLFNAVDSTTDTLTVEAGNELFVQSGYTFAPAGNLWDSSTGIDSLDIRGTFDASTGADYRLAGNFANAGTYNTSTETITMTGTANTFAGGGATFYNLTIDPSSTGTITAQTTDATVSNALSVAAGDTLSIASGRTVTHTGGTFTFPNTAVISGSGTLRFTDTSSGPGATGTLSSVVRFDATGASIPNTTIDARTYGGTVEFYSDFAGARTFTLASTTYNFSSNVSLITGASQSGNVTLTGVPNNPVMNITGDLTVTKVGGSPRITSGIGAWTVAGNVDFTNLDVFTGTTNNDFTMTGAGTALYGNNSAFYNLIIDPSSAGTITIHGGAVAGGTLTIATGDVANFFDSSAYFDIGELTLDGTLSGAGTLYYYTATTFPSTGTITCKLQLYLGNVDLTIPQRTFGGDVQLFNDIVTGHKVTFGTGAGQTINFSAGLTIDATSTGDATIDAATHDPNINVTGSIDFTGAGGGTEIINAGAGTWTVGGSANFTDGQYNTEAGNTLVMNGSGTLTTGTVTLLNLTLSGTITLADATHTVSGDLDMTGGTITAGSSVMKMTGTSNSIKGGGATLTGLTIDPATTGTITLQNSDLTVSGTLTIAAGDTLSLGSGRILTHSGAAFTWGDSSSTISGSGILRFIVGSSGPGTGGILSAPVRYDASTNNISSTTPDARTYGGVVEFYSNVAAIRTITLPGGTFNFSSDMKVVTGAAQSSSLTLIGATSSPTINITGNFSYTKGGGGALIVTSGFNTWTVSGDANFTDGTYTPTTTNTFVMNGTGNKKLTGNGQTLKNLTIDPTSADTITLQTSDLSVSGTLTVAASDILSLDAGRTLFVQTTGDFTLLGTVSGSGRLTYQSATNFPTTGVISSIVRYDASSIATPYTVVERTYGGDLEVYLDNLTSGTSTVTLATTFPATIDVTGNFYVIAAGKRNLHLDGDGTTPDVNVGGNLDYTGSGTGSESIAAGNGTWTVSGSVNFTDGTFSAATGHTLIMNGTGTLTSNNQTLQNLTLSGAITLADATHTVAEDLNMTGGTITAGSSTVTMVGVSNTIVGGGATLNNLIINPTNGNITLQTSDLTVSGTLTIGAAADGDSDTLTIDTGRTLTSGTAGTVTFVASGTDTITGSGTLVVKNSNLDTDGVLSAPVIFDASSGGVTAPYRNYANDVTAYANNASNRDVNFGSGSGSAAITGNLYVNDDSAGGGYVRLLFQNSGTYTVSGNLDMIGSGARHWIWLGGTGTSITVSGNIDLTGIESASGNAGATMTMDGSGKNLISSTATWENLTLSGSITLANATHTVAGDFSMAGGTITAGTSTLKMTGTSNSIVGGGNTLTNLTIDPASAGTITLQTSNLTVSGTLSVASGDVFTIDTGRTLTHSGATLTLTGTMDGGGLYIYKSATAFPTGGILNVDLRMDGTNNNQTLGQRTYGGDVELYSNSSSNRVMLLGTGSSQTLTFSGNLTINTANTGGLEMDGNDWDPLLNLTGNFSAPVGGGGVVLVSAPCSGTWTFSGNLDLDNVSWSECSETVKMNGTGGKYLDGGGQYINSLTIDPSSAATITLQNSDLSMDGTLTIAAGDTLSLASGRILLDEGPNVVWGDSASTISGAGTLLFDSASSGPASGGILSSVVRYYADGNIISTTVDARTYGGAVEFYSDVAALRSITLPSGTFNFSSNVSVITGASQSSVLTVDASNGGSSNPTVNIGGNLTYTKGGSATPAITTGNGTWTVTGDVNLTNGTFTATAGNTLKMNGSSKTITSASTTLRNFEISGGSVANADAMIVNGTFHVTGGTFTAATEVNMTIFGDFTLDTGISFTGPTGAGKIIFDGDLTELDNTAGLQNQGNVQIGASPGTVNLASDQLYAALTVSAGDFFYTNGYDIQVVGALTINGTFDATDDVETDETLITAKGNVAINSGATFVQDQSTLKMAATSGTKTLITDGSFSLYNLTLDDGGGSLTVQVQDPLDVDNNVTITGGTLDVVSGENNQINVGGNWDNNDIFTARNGKVVFDAGATSKTVEAGSSSFYDVDFNNASGGWTVQTDNMTVSHDLNLTAGAAFTLASGRTLEVDGNFNQAIAGANTTWTGSTLYLNGSGGMYDTNTKTHGGDTYATIRVGGSEDIAMWDSSATTYTMDAGGCLFSEDHGGTAGRLNIYGTCNSRANEYWSYATDFDGAALGGSSRQADVQFASGASLTVDAGDTLAILGQSAGANRSLISHQSSGNYSLTIDGTINAQYYDFDYLDANGLNITSTATVTELSDGSFDNAGSGVSSSYIIVTGITSTDSFANNVFDDNTDGADANVVYNVNADGAGIDWTFTDFSGNKGGEDYDREVNGAVITWVGGVIPNLTFSLSANTIDLGLVNPWGVNTANHTLSITTNATNGYTCTATQDGNLRNGGSDINPVSGGTVDAGSEEYGIACSGGGCALAGDNSLASPLTVATSAGPVSGETTTVTYKAAVSGTTAALNYQQIVTYTCTGNF